VHRSEVEALFCKYGILVYRRARHLLGNHEDAEEAVQEVFIRVWQNIATFEHRSQVCTWLVRITTNCCLNVLRHRKVRRELWSTYLQDCAEAQESPSLDLLLLVKALLAEVDEACSAAVIHVLVDGLTQEEAAERMGVSRRTITNQLDRFKKRAAVLLSLSSLEPVA
jgi:RNA polymerase sigma-70 factor, ECF subfamily